MIKNVFRIGAVYTGLFFLVAVNFTHAFTFDVNPATQNVTNPVTFNVSFELSESGIINDTYWCMEVDDGNDFYYSSETYAIGSDPQTGSFVYNNLPIGFTPTHAYLVSMSGDIACDGNNWNEASLELYYDGGNPLFTVIVGNTSSSVFLNGGILGDSANGTALLASVAGGVRETGTSVWPLFVLVGIPLAFIFGLALVGWIRYSTVDPRVTTGTRKRKGYSANSGEVLNGRNYRVD